MIIKKKKYILIFTSFYLLLPFNLLLFRVFFCKFVLSKNIIMLPYLIAGAIGFGVAKLFENSNTSKYDDGGDVSEKKIPRVPKTYELELDYKVGQWFKEDIVGGTADCYITSIDFQVNEINGLPVVHPDSYRIEYKNTTYGSTNQVHYNFIKNLKKEKNKIKIEVPYSIGGGIFFENSGQDAYDNGTKLFNGVVEAFKVMYYGTRNDWFNYYTNINGKDYRVDSKDAYSSINNYISRVSNDGFVEKKLETFKEPIGGELKVKLDYEIGQKIKVPVMGGFKESEITGITIGINAEDGKIVKDNHNSTISYKNVWGGNKDVTEIYANFEKEEYANKIENEIIIDIKALYLEQYITLHRYMGGAKLKVDRVQGYKLIIDKNGIKTGYIADDVRFEIFTSINDFKEKISIESEDIKILKIISEKLNVSNEKSLDIIEHLKYPKKHYEENKNADTDKYENYFSVDLSNVEVIIEKGEIGSSTNVKFNNKKEFNNSKEVFDYIITDEFIESVYSFKDKYIEKGEYYDEINEVIISLYGIESLKIKFYRYTSLVLSDGNSDFDNNGQVLRIIIGGKGISPFIQSNIENKEDFIKKVKKAISDFITAYKIYVLNDYTSEKEI